MLSYSVYYLISVVSKCEDLRIESFFDCVIENCSNFAHPEFHVVIRSEKGADKEKVAVDVKSLF